MIGNTFLKITNSYNDNEFDNNINNSKNKKIIKQ